MKKMTSTLMAVMLLMTLAACNSSNIEYDKDAAIAAAEDVVDVINTRDYEAITALFREDLQADVTADSLEAAWDSSLQEAGEFVGYKKETTRAVNQAGVDYIVVVLVSEYENNSLTYTISFDTDMNVAGMYMK